MLIALNGPAGAGKDSVAIVLQKQGYVRIAFADALKEAALAINPVLMTNWQADTNKKLPMLSEYRLSDAVEILGWDEAKRTIPEVRRILQALGVGARDVIDPSVWIDLVATKINKAKLEGTTDFVITDMRFENEAVLVRSLGGIAVRIERPSNPNKISSTHVSEQFAVSTPYVIINDGTLQDLELKVLNLRNQILENVKRRRHYVFNGEMQCNKCDVWKQLENFPLDEKTTSGRAGTCRDCTNLASKAKPSRQPDKRAVEFRNRDKAALREYSRTKLLLKYGMTNEEYETLWLAQDGKCAICKEPETRVDSRTGVALMLSVDHDHTTGVVRGLLCTKDNKAIGALGDSQEAIQRVLDYLKGK